MSTSFYATAPALRHFADLAREDAYAPVPGDHHVVVTDVIGSTEAVRAGRYREVNYVGAASIAAVLNATDHADIPFVFGGDGATLVVPGDLLPATEAALAALRQHASEAFGFELRAGVIPVHAIRAAGHRLAVARYEVSPNYVQAMFVGSGLTHAERLVKDPATRERYEISAEALVTDDPYLGLECRWEDVRSASGETITLLVNARGQTEADRLTVYRDVVHTIEAIYGDESSAHPIAPDRLRLSHSLRRFAPEIQLRHERSRRWRQGLRLWALNLLGIVLIRLGLETSETDWARYPTLLREATDYRKFDDMLRMVLSGTTSQRRHLDGYLEQRYRAGALTYGLHVSDRAVLTCLVHERMGRQVHFVDGADGGYTMAAAALNAAPVLRFNPPDPAMQTASTSTATDLAPAQARRLLDLCVALNTIHDPDALLQLIIETATDILDCEAASLLLYDEATGRLRFEAATGQHADALAEIFVPLDRSIAGTIFRENRTLLIEDADRDERHFKGASEATGLHTQVLLGVPMRIEGAPVGVLEALNPRRGAFSEADIETLSIVSAQAAVAIRNARQRQALRTANDRLARLDQLKNDFMAVASHELRTPVSIVLGFGTVLRDESDGHLAVMAADVMAAGKRMQEIIETVEEMSAIQAESIKLERHPVEIQQVLRETWTHVGVEAEIEHTRIDLPDAPLWVHGDHRRLLLVFEALLKNACTFTPRSGSVELTLTRRESDLFVTLCDTGCGLAEADLHRIFEAFYQADAPLTRPHDGLGVGLTMAETLARLHDGHIWAESDGRGRGSTFHVRLPLYQP